MTAALQAHDLAGFTGTEHWYRHPLNAKMLYTDGVKYLAEKGEAYWLLDEIALLQANRAVRGEEFQVWKLVADKKANGATLTCEDGDERVVLTKRIPFTDFPLPEVAVWVEGNVILLPSEH